MAPYSPHREPLGLCQDRSSASELFLNSAVLGVRNSKLGQRTNVRFSTFEFRSKAAELIKKRLCALRPRARGEFLGAVGFGHRGATRLCGLTYPFAPGHVTIRGIYRNHFLGRTSATESPPQPNRQTLRYTVSLRFDCWLSISFSKASSSRWRFFQKLAQRSPCFSSRA